MVILKDEMTAILKDYGKHPAIIMNSDWKAWEILERVWIITSGDVTPINFDYIFNNPYGREGYSKSLFEIYGRHL
jgi:hypothetical protein